MAGALIFSLFLTWIQVSSDTYIVKSSAGEERAKRVLRELEGFHQLVGSTVVFGATELPELPIEVLLIGDEEMLKELEPEYNGRKLPVPAYYQAGPDRDFIVLSGRVYPERLTSLVYHELTHYFVSRGLQSRPAWLNEGLAEYFSTAEIRDDEITLGAVSADRLQLLRTGPMLSLKDFFAVDSSSPHYNELSKASVYYAEAWAFMHYMMHGEHAPRFRQYLKALQKNDADLLQYLNVSERELENGFQSYLKVSVQRPARNTVKVSGEAWEMHVETIPESEAQISIAEILLANGRLPEARRHLEVLAAEAPDSTRVSYYRGVLARLAGNEAAREFFVDALLDPFLAPRAAVQLVAMGDMHIPAVRTILEDAAARKTRNAEVYLALATIHLEDVRRIEEAVRLKSASDSPPVKPRVTESGPSQPATEWRSYMHGAADAGKVTYDLLSDSSAEPRVNFVVAPYYPPELLQQNVSGEVIMDVQVTGDGKVGGLWLVSAIPEIFETLATSSVRDWEFDRNIPAKIRVVMRFKP
jgi:tetratricopeptide (TPR) repeat protein